jgi:hypothetical protein
VQSVGLAGVRILKNNESDSWMTIEGYTPRPGDRPDAYMNWIGPGYFAALGVPIVEGRDFTSQDTQEVLHREPDNWVPAKIVVNESFAKRYFRARVLWAGISATESTGNQGGHGDYRSRERHQVHEPPQ